MRYITKKTWPEFFNLILSGEKTGEIRIADFEVDPGDCITFEEFDPHKKMYTGRTVTRKVTGVWGVRFEKFNKSEEAWRHGHLYIQLEDPKVEALQRDKEVLFGDVEAAVADRDASQAVLRELLEEITRYRKGGFAFKTVFADDVLRFEPRIRKALDMPEEPPCST